MTDQPTNQQLTPAEIRLAQYGERTSTWSTAAYDSGTEKALHEIALGLKAEIDRLRTQRRVLLASIARKDARTGEGDRALREFLNTPEAADAPVAAEQPAQAPEPHSKPEAAPQAERIRALALLEAADRYAKLADQNEAYDRRQGDLDERARIQHETVRDVAAGLRHLADEADPMVGSLARDGLGLDEIADMLARPAVPAVETGR
ncbi:hypothetical protein TUSST3_08830 [Streptomyces sp. TUS-ST3]|uniref:hypothetical protein n=1 Tax=Streptomyces sp. TUS-ST3 TaxID=3025591 RepID=UPI0024E106B4|nr:hypothetical protein [Streptomyces sp. TUS-ST3]GLP64263.1 hypothetical protein TUSST3_08830 [Streptomyces sp. TUS-ST3]